MSVLVLAGLLFSGVVCQNSVEELFANMNMEGFPLELLVKAAGLNTSLRADVLPELLEEPDVRMDAQSVALYSAAKRLLNAPDTSRALLTFDWADPGLCSYTWLSWLPWLDCEVTRDSDVQHTQSDDFVQECYHSYVEVRRRNDALVL